MRGVTQTCKLLELKDQHRESIGIEIVLSRSAPVKVPATKAAASKKQVGVKNEAAADAKQESGCEEQTKVEIAAQTDPRTTEVATTTEEAAKDDGVVEKRDAEKAQKRTSSHKRHKPKMPRY